MPEEIRKKRWQLIRDSLVFQGKLLIDGFRDFLLVPAAMGATLLGLITHPREPDYYFKRVINWGEKSEIWINLFDSQHHSDKSPQLDDLVKIAEEKILAEYARGGLTTSMKDAIDRGMDKPRKTKGAEKPEDNQA